MKHAYGSYVYSSGELFEALQELDDIDSMPTESTVYLLVDMAEWMIRNGNGLHVFFTGENMETWLRKAAPPLGEEQYLTMMELPEPLMLHFKRGGAYLITKGTKHQSHGNFIVSTGRGQPIYSLSMTSAHENISRAEIDMVNLVSGAVAYMKAFPDAISDGIPEDLIRPNHYRKCRCLNIKIAKQLSNGVSPHYRSGHFRVLTSPRFTHARGKVLFIHGCFVKGRAITVKE